MIALEIEVEAGGWTSIPGLEALCRSAADAALAAWPGTPPGDCGATLLLADDAAARALNQRWRQQDKPTNVLSFPAPPGIARPRHLGDLVMAFETVAREADDEGKPIGHHLAHLVVHGLYHLLGLDHATDQEAEEMEATEVVALARLGIADPYRDAA